MVFCGLKALESYKMTRLRIIFACASFLFACVSKQALAVDSKVVEGLSLVTTGISAVWAGSSLFHCSCVSQKCPPPIPGATCSMAPLSALSLASSVAQLATNTKSGAEWDDVNVGGLKMPDEDPMIGPGGSLPALSNSDWDKICSTNRDMCNDCANSGDFSGCKPELLLPEELMSFESSDPEINTALDTVKDAIAKINEAEFSSSDSLAPSLDASIADQVKSGFADGELADSDPLYLKKEKGIGAANKEGLGLVSMWGMDLVDEKSGKKLNVFQRARRRYYNSPQNKRLNFLARAEYIRAKAMQHAKRQLERKEITAQASAARAPASETTKIEQKNSSKH